MFSIIVAMDKNGVIGAGNSLPWHIPEDLKRFRFLTLGKSVIMGRRTYESIGHPLKGRKNIILTNNKNYEAPGCEISLSLDDVILNKYDGEETFIIGGESIYCLFMQYAVKVYATVINKEYEGDVLFPKHLLNNGKWREIERNEIRGNDVDYSFQTLVRIRGSF